MNYIKTKSQKTVDRNKSKAKSVNIAPTYTDEQLKAIRKSSVREEFVKLLLDQKLDSIDTTESLVEQARVIEKYLLEPFEELNRS